MFPLPSTNEKAFPNLSVNWAFVPALAVLISSAILVNAFATSSGLPST